MFGGFDDDAVMAEIVDDEFIGLRHQRLRARRSWRRRTGVAAVVVLGVGATVGVAIAISSDDPPAADPGVTVARPSTTASSRPAEAITPIIRELSELPAGRPLTHEDPLRLWIGGDSLAGAMGPVVGQYAEDSGVVRALVDFKVSSGIAARVRDWPEYAGDLIADEDPEAIVFMVGANDAHIASTDLESWEPEYREDVGEMMDLLVGRESHRTVFWVGSPPMELSARERGIKELNRIYEDEARARPDVVYVDAYAMFEGPNGGYDSSIEIPGEGLVRVRIGDGVHLTTAGAEWLGFNVWKLVDERWDVGTYAQPELPIDYRTAPGGHDGCCSGGGTTQTVDTSDVTIETTTTTTSCEVTASCETTTTLVEQTTTTVISETTVTTIAETTTTVAPSEPEP
jgi:hypothetical protein